MRCKSSSNFLAGEKLKRKKVAKAGNSRRFFFTENNKINRERNQAANDNFFCQIHPAIYQSYKGAFTHAVSTLQKQHVATRLYMDILAKP